MAQYLYPISDLYRTPNSNNCLIKNEANGDTLWSSINNGIATANDSDYIGISGNGHNYLIFETGPVLVRPEDALIGIRALSFSGVAKCSAYLIDQRCSVGNIFSNFGGALGELNGFGVAVFLSNDDNPNTQPLTAITEIGSVNISGSSFANYTIYPNIYDDYNDWDFTNSALALRFTSLYPYDDPPFPIHMIRVSEVEVQLSGDPVCTNEFFMHIPGGVRFENRTNVPSGYTYQENLGDWVGDYSFAPAFDLGFYPLQENSGTSFFPVGPGPTGLINSENQWRNAFSDPIGGTNYRTVLQLDSSSDKYGFLDLQTTGDFTIFFKLNTVTSNSDILSKGIYPGNLEYSFVIDSNRTLEIGMESTSNQYISLDSQLPADNVFIAATYGPDNKLRLYHTDLEQEDDVSFNKLSLVGTSDVFSRTVNASSIYLGDGGGLVVGNNNTYLSNLGFANYAMAHSGLSHVVENWNRLTKFIDDVPNSSVYINYKVENSGTLDEFDTQLFFHVPVEDYYYQVDSPLDNRNGPLSQQIASSSCVVLDMYLSHNTNNTGVYIQPTVLFRYSPHRWTGHSTLIPSSQMSLFSISGTLRNDIYHIDNGNYHAAIGQEEVEPLTEVFHSGNFRSFLVSPQLAYSDNGNYYSDFRIHSVQLRTEAWMLPRTGVVEDDNFPLYISGKQGVDDNIDLFIEGGDRSKSCDLFIQSIGNQSGDITLFLEATPNSHMPLTLWSQPAGARDNSFDLFIHAIPSGELGAIGGFDLFIEGNNFNANMPLYIGGPNSADQSSNMPLFISAVQEGTRAGFDLFLNNNYSAIYSGFPMFTECTHIDSNASMNLFINRENDSTSENFPMYISGPSGLDTNFSLFIEGANKLNEDMTLFISGNGTLNNNISLYSHGF